MNENQKNQGVGGLEVSILFLGVAFFLIKLAEKVTPKITTFWNLHRIQVLVAVSFTATFSLVLLGCYLWNKFVEWDYERAITADAEMAIYLGRDDKDKPVYLRQEFRTAHAQVIGTTGVGKTDSIILPWTIKDIQNGSGILIIDGKSDRSFLDKLYAYVVASGREKDFRLFSLFDVEASSTFNPLYGGSPQEIAERVFSSFLFENEYYRNVQYKILLSMLLLLEEQKIIPTFRLVHRLLTDTAQLNALLQSCRDEALKRILSTFCSEPEKERVERISGLEAALSHFCTGKVGPLFHSKDPGITMERALNDGLICYFQLPTMKFPFLAQATGKLVLQCFQSAVSSRHQVSGLPKFFSCFLDDFQDYIYEGFGGLLNKARSANVGVVFSHQALGDLDKVSPAFRNVVMTCTNIKVVMRGNDPDTCDYFAKSFGTKTVEKVTERRTKNMFGSTNTGEGSVREAEEFIIHPNTIKNFGTGKGVISIPHPKGVKQLSMRFQRQADLVPVPLPIVEKPDAPLDIALIPSSTSAKPKDSV